MKREQDLKYKNKKNENKKKSVAYNYFKYYLYFIGSFFSSFFLEIGALKYDVFSKSYIIHWII